MDLTNKLRRFLSTENKTQKERLKSRVDLDPILQGEEITTPYGPCYVVERSFPLAKIHGRLSFNIAFEQEYTQLHYLTPEANFEFHIEDALFIDTETTGLAGGTGTYAFLVGLGYFTADQFVVKQLLMRDYNEELGLLYLLNKVLQQKRCLVSFNGKSFDLPLLQTRFTISRLDLKGFNHMKHLDLLHMSRKLWRHKLASCSLNSLERNILGVIRTDDIPGFEIPQRYFDFLSSGEGKLLQDIVEHNLLDILSMPLLLSKLAATVQLEPAHCNCPWLGEALAQLALTRENEGLALSYLKAARNLCQGAEQHVRILRSKAAIYKRLGENHKACNLWREILKTFASDLDALEELAKYYEHKAKDFQKAEQMTRRGLAIAWQKKAASVPAWEHRLQRIQRKTELRTS